VVEYGMAVVGSMLAEVGWMLAEGAHRLCCGDYGLCFLGYGWVNGGLVVCFDGYWDL
jgi:hypothetical protein